MRSQAEQLKISETLLAEIQHGRRAVPESLRRLIRDYFSDHERGRVINKPESCLVCYKADCGGVDCHNA